MRRLHSWLPSATTRHGAHAIAQIKLICRDAQPYMGLSVLRMMVRGICTSARFHDRPRPCCVGCPRANDDLVHYARCPRFEMLARRLFQRHHLAAPESLPWLCGYFPLAIRDAKLRRLAASFLDAFFAAHALWRHGRTERIEVAMEARIRQHCKRHPRIAQAWGWLALDILPA